ncbi:hypothetical protein Trydic_g6144 [Trypoxylus dichotomus]
MTKASIRCKFYGFLGGTSGTVSMCILSAISFDRFHVIKYPLTRQPSHTRTKFFIFICWIYGAVFSLIPAFDVGFGTYVPEAYLVSCSYEYLTDKPQVKHFIFAFFIAAWVVPFCLILFSYINIVYVIYNSRHAATSSFGGSYRHVKKKQKIKQEIKVAIVVLFVICVWFVAWTPYAIVSLLGIFGILGIEDLIAPQLDGEERPQQSAISQPPWWDRPSLTDDCSLAKAKKLVRSMSSIRRHEDRRSLIRKYQFNH